MTFAGNFAWCRLALWLQHQRYQHVGVLSQGHTDITLDFNPEPHTFNTGSLRQDP